MFRADMNHQQMKERGVFASLPELNFLFPESFEIMMARKLDRWTERGRTLNKDFSGHIAAAGPSGNLGQELKSPFSSPKIGHMQADVGVDDADQGNVWKIKAFGNHLSSDQNVNFTRSKSL